MRRVAASGLLVCAALLQACGAPATSTVPPAGSGPAAATAVPAGPEPPAELVTGRDLFDAKCAECHGVGAVGTDKGPPFIHQVYVPSHHGDMSFVLAALQGVRAHHWQFGDMPPVAGITEPEVREIVPYVRWLQAQAGIQ
jgi:mono/diheme cytochrome c family protein